MHSDLNILAYIVHITLHYDITLVFRTIAWLMLMRKDFLLKPLVYNDVGLVGRLKTNWERIPSEVT